jgi:hypothetical protein
VTMIVTPAARVSPPELPHISIHALDGMPLGTPNDPHLRMNRLLVRNLSEVEINHFCSRVQLPEPIVTSPNFEIEKSVGVSIEWRPILTKLLISGMGGRSESGLWIGPSSSIALSYQEECFVPEGDRAAYVQVGGAEITGIWELMIDKLPPRGHISILFFTSSSPEAKSYIDFSSGLSFAGELNINDEEKDSDELRFYLEGEYRFFAGVLPGKLRFLVPIIFDAETRKLSSTTIQSEAGNWRPVTLAFY